MTALEYIIINSIFTIIAIIICIYLKNKLSNNNSCNCDNCEFLRSKRSGLCIFKYRYCCDNFHIRDNYFDKKPKYCKYYQKNN